MGAGAASGSGTVSGATEREISERRLYFKRLLQDGTAFRKYGHHGFPHMRHVYLSPDARYVLWCSPSTAPSKNHKDGIAVSDITDVVDGTTTPVFRTNAGWYKHPELCFSLVAASRTLDLEAASAEEKREWMTALLCLKRYRSTI